MIGSIFFGSWRVSDSGLLNMSGMDSYLSTLFRTFSIYISGASNQFPALYGDGVFPQLPTIVARMRRSGREEERMIATRMASVRQSNEHIFAIHKNIFHLFNQPEQFRLLYSGVFSCKLIFPLMIGQFR